MKPSVSVPRSSAMYSSAPGGFSGITVLLIAITFVAAALAIVASLIGWWSRDGSQDGAVSLAIAMAITVVILAVGITLVWAPGFRRDRAIGRVQGGDGTADVAAIHAQGCGACHTISGIVGADATVGPSLSGWARQKTIAGHVPNDFDHLVTWLMDPPAVDPETDMPNLHLTDQEARDIAAYLLSLQ
jgi:cytochrome c1